MKETRKKGHDFKDFICPDSMEFEKDYFKMGNRYGRVLFLREYASYIKDSMVAELTDMNRNLMMSIDIVPVPLMKQYGKRRTVCWVWKPISRTGSAGRIQQQLLCKVPYDMEQQRKEMKEFLDDLTTRDQRMMFAVITMVHTADSKEQLDNDTEALLTTARKHLCQFAVLKFQQVDGLNTVMPFGTRKIDAPPYPHNREPCGVYPIQGAGYFPRKRYLLRSECYQQKYDYCRPQAAFQR